MQHPKIGGVFAKLPVENAFQQNQCRNTPYLSVSRTFQSRGPMAGEDLLRSPRARAQRELWLDNHRITSLYAV